MPSGHCFYKGASIIQRIAILLIGILCAVSLTACQRIGQNAAGVPGGDTGTLTIEMELDENYSNADPFVNARLFFASEEIDVLDAELSFEMEGESGLVEIKDRQSDETLWSKAWSGNTDHETAAVSLEHLGPDQEYVIRFTGTEIKHALIEITFDSNLVQERVRPLK